MTRRALFAITVAVSLGLAASGPAIGSDAKPAPQALPYPVVTGITVLQGTTVISSAATTSVLAPNLVKDVNYKVRVVFSTPLSAGVTPKPNPALRSGPLHESTRSAAGEVRVTNSTSQQAQIVNPATQPVPGLGAGKATAVEWDYKAPVNGQHLFAAKVK